AGEIPRSGQGGPERLLRPHAGGEHAVGGEVPSRGRDVRRLPVLGRLLRAAKPGAAAVAAVKAGVVDGDHGLPAALAKAGVVPKPPSPAARPQERTNLDSLGTPSECGLSKLLQLAAGLGLFFGVRWLDTALDVGQEESKAVSSHRTPNR